MQHLYLATQEHYAAHCVAYGEPMGQTHEKHTLITAMKPSVWLVKLRDRQKNTVAMYRLSLKPDGSSFFFVRVYTLAFLSQYEAHFKALRHRWEKEAQIYFASGKPTGASVIGAGYCVWVQEEQRRTKIAPHAVIYQPSYYGEGAWGNTGRFIDSALKELGLDFFYECGRLD